jgi:hypothetical protein
MSEEEIRVGDLIEAIPGMGPRILWGDAQGDDVIGYAFPDEIFIVVECNAGLTSMRVTNTLDGVTGWISSDCVQVIK